MGSVVILFQDHILFLRTVFTFLGFGWHDPILVIPVGNSFTVDGFSDGFTFLVHISLLSQIWHCSIAKHKDIGLLEQQPKDIEALDSLLFMLAISSLQNHTGRSIRQECDALFFSMQS